VWTRLAEIGLAVGVAVALWQQSLLLVCVFFILLAAQSAFFSPAKYGVVPDLVSDGGLSRANGVLSMLTNMAIILGMAVAGVLLGVGPVFIGLIMIVIAIISLFSSLRIPKLPPAEPELHVSARTFTAHVRVLRRIRGTPLLHATLAWSWFYAVGSLVITIVPMWRAELQLSDAAAGAMLAAPGVGIGLGGLAAGLASGQRIRAGFIPIGAAGMAASFLVLGLLAPALWSVLILLILVGVFAGFYVIPILSMLQHLPVPSFRARTIGTANFITYVAMAISAVIYGVLAPIVGGEPAPWFLACAVAMGIVFVASLLQHKGMCEGAAASAHATVGESRVREDPDTGLSLGRFVSRNSR
jgi:acyl-[acyl-carrier-protein]-phospholipid O-acyltransferase/long-chain-fatty-acid--[acyl-carrier-protein] ligase